MTSTAVVIPCRNEAEHIGPLLDALAAQTSVPSRIVVVDDASTDDTVAGVRQWQASHPSVPGVPGVTILLIAGPGRGPGPAMNCGIAATDAEVIIRFDAHSVPDPDYVERSVASVRDPKVGVAGGVWRIHAGAPTAVAHAIAAVVSHPLGSGGALYRHADAGGPERQSVETVPFGTFRRGLWEQLGGFDEQLSANQDFDFNYRARAAGFAVVLDRNIKATYIARPTLAALGRQYFRYGFWKLQMLRKDPRALHWRQIPPALVLPWVVVTGAWALTAQTVLSGLCAAVYPVLLLGGALQLGGRGVNVPAAFAAMATVHLSWSAGFWRGVLWRSVP